MNRETEIPETEIPETEIPETEIPGQLAASWLRELQRDWHSFNREYLREALRAPQLELAVESTSTLGSWLLQSRRLRISLLHLTRDPWHLVQETLRHEMAHQFADEVLLAKGEAPHGPAFREACRRLRVSARATAPPCQSRADQAPNADVQEPPKIVTTVRKLLALGSSSNENEAAAAMRKAQALLAKHKIELEDFGTSEGFERAVLGAVKGRHAAWEYARALLLTDFFFVEAIWIPSVWVPKAARGTEPTCRRGSVLEIHGRRADVALAAWVHDWLEDTLARLWLDYRRRKSLSGNRERLRYFDGLLRGFHGKLERERTDTRDQHGIVPRHDAELQEHFRWIYPRIRSVTGRTKTSEAYDDGLKDGARIDLRRPVADRAAGRSPRALPGS